MRTLIKWGGIEREGYFMGDSFRCGEFILNHEVVNHLKIGEYIYLDDFINFVELTGISDHIKGTGDYFDTFYGATERKSQDDYLIDLKNAISEIGNGASKVEEIYYYYKGSEFVKVIHLSAD